MRRRMQTSRQAFDVAQNLRQAIGRGSVGIRMAARPRLGGEGPHAGKFGNWECFGGGEYRRYEEQEDTATHGAVQETRDMLLPQHSRWIARKADYLRHTTVRLAS